MTAAARYGAVSEIVEERLDDTIIAAVLTALAFLAGGCAPSDQSILSPAGPAARRLADLGWPVMLLFLAVSAATWILLPWAALRRRGTLDQHAPIHTGGGLAWVWIGGLAIPAVVLGTVLVLTLRTLASFPLAASTSELRIRVVGHQW